MTTIDAITARLVALGDLVDGVNKADDKLPRKIADADLPYLFVTHGPATHTEVQQGTIQTSREWLLLLYVQAFQRDNVDSEKAARDAASPFIAKFLKYFWARPTLALNGVPLDAFVEGMLGKDEGVKATDQGETFYAAIPFTITVSYTEDFDIE